MSYSNSTIGLSAIQEKAKHYCQSLIEKYESNIPFKGHDGRYHYIYLSYHKETYRFYIGKHSSKDFLSDEYTGSGRLYGKALKKHGRDAFEHHHLAFFNTPEEALAKEAEEVTLEMIDNTFKGQIYNLQEGGVGGNLSKESREKVAQSLREKTRYCVKKEDVTREVIKTELPLFLEDGWKLTYPTQVPLYHTESKSKIKVEVGKPYTEQDILEALSLGFIFGRAPKEHNPLEETLDPKILTFFANREKRRQKRSAETQRDKACYTLKKEDVVKEGVTREELLILIRADWKITHPTHFSLYHPNMKINTIRVGIGTSFAEQDILEALSLGFIFGRAPKGHNPLEETLDPKILTFFANREKTRSQKIAQHHRDKACYTLKKEDVVKEEVTREELPSLLQDNWKITHPIQSIQLYHPNVKRGIGVLTGKGYTEEDILEALSLGFIFGKTPRGHSPSEENLTSELVVFLANRQSIKGERRAKSLQNNKLEKVRE